LNVPQESIENLREQEQLMMTQHGYRYLYAPPTPVPQRAAIAYVNPVLTEEEPRRRASKLATQEAALRRAKLAERWIVFTVAGVLAITMLPVVVVIAAIAAAVAIWRRTARWIKRCWIVAAPVGESLPDSLSEHAVRSHADSVARSERQPLSFASDLDASPEVANAY
jgi:hypothetical protein